MNCIVASNDGTVSAGYGSHEAGCEDDSIASTTTWTLGSPRKTLVLSRIEHELIRAFSTIDAVNALYAERDDDGVLMVFVVVPQHDDAAYQQVIAAEYGVRARINEDFELRVRAHQGRNTVRAVPIRSLPLFLK